MKTNILFILIDGGRADKILTDLEDVQLPNIQKLVNHCVALETTEERDKMAKAIVDVMGNLQPHLRDVPDFKHIETGKHLDQKM